MEKSKRVLKKGAIHFRNNRQNTRKKLGKNEDSKIMMWNENSKKQIFGETVFSNVNFYHLPQIC